MLETNIWQIKVYAPPREHGPPHVHVIAKRSRVEVKISLVDLKVLGKTQMSRRTVKDVIIYIWQNHEYLMNCWEKLHE